MFSCAHLRLVLAVLVFTCYGGHWRVMVSILACHKHMTKPIRTMQCYHHQFIALSSTLDHQCQTMFPQPAYIKTFINHKLIIRTVVSMILIMLKTAPNSKCTVKKIKHQNACTKSNIQCMQGHHSLTHSSGVLLGLPTLLHFFLSLGMVIASL